MARNDDGPEQGEHGDDEDEWPVAFEASDERLRAPVPLRRFDVEWTEG
jgi:hypothetical protein